MDELKNFKNVADEMMSDIKVGEDLKRRTLERCKKKNHISFGKVLIPAACLLLTFGYLNISGILPLRSQPTKEENTDYNVLVDSGQDTTMDAEGMPESAASTQIQDNSVVNVWTLSTTEEAGKSFGSAFLTPDYVPGEYQIDQIQALGAAQNDADTIIINYLSGDKSFYIMEEKSASQEWGSDYKEISLKGTLGYIKSYQTEGEAGIGSLFTELHWFKEGNNYSVSGQITEEEAINVAEAMH